MKWIKINCGGGCHQYKCPVCGLVWAFPTRFCPRWECTAEFEI